MTVINHFNSRRSVITAVPVMAFLNESFRPQFKYKINTVRFVGPHNIDAEPVFDNRNYKVSFVRSAPFLVGRPVNISTFMKTL